HSSSGLTPLYSRCCHTRSGLGTTPTLEVRAGRVNDMTLNAYRRVAPGMSHLQVHVELPAVILLIATIILRRIHPRRRSPPDPRGPGNRGTRRPAGRRPPGSSDRPDGCDADHLRPAPVPPLRLPAPPRRTTLPPHHAAPGQWHRRLGNRCARRC